MVREMQRSVKGLLGGGLRPNDPRRFLIEAMVGDGEDSPVAKHCREHQGIYCMTFKVKSAQAAAVAKRYADRPIVRIFSIRIERGDRIGFVGQNGSGKTTLINLLTGARQILYGKLDITFYRDDVRKGLHEINRTDIPFSIENKQVVLIDDVLWTGRTIRAALDALVTAYGQAAGNAFFYLGGVLNFVSSLQGLPPAVQRQLGSPQRMHFWLGPASGWQSALVRQTSVWLRQASWTSRSAVDRGRPQTILPIEPTNA